MRTKVIVYETSNGIRGSAREIADKLGVDHRSVFKACNARKILKGQKIKKVGYYYTPYRLYRNGVFTFEGSPEEIANKIYTTTDNVFVALLKGRVMADEYTVNRGDTIFVEK